MRTRKLTLLLLMIVASMAAVYLTPTHKIATDRENFVLEDIVPTTFDDWRMVDDGTKGIVNPQQESLINKLYNQTLSRSYVNSNNERIMLVIAYGENQSDNTQLHYPEVCYPAQGFQITSNMPAVVKTEMGNIKVKKLIATLSNRVEPIIYWTTIGNKVVRGSTETKLEKLKYGFNGSIADGLLFRVSTIDANPESAYKLEIDFINKLIANLPASSLAGVTGLNKLH